MIPTKTLYLECYSGISGDMMVGALLDLGADQDVLRAGLDSLHVKGYTTQISRSLSSSIDACDFHVILDHPEHDPYSEESQPHHSPEHGHSHEHGHIHEHGHSHEHDHHHDAAHAPQIPDQILHLGHHEHRNLSEIEGIIDHSGITPKAKETAKRIFSIVAAAESKAHGKPVEEVHFHEVGAVDSIVDIVAAAICLDNLNIEQVIVTELYEGTGTISCQHGILPIPVPAVVNISAAHQLPLHITNTKGELVTPTGAAIAAAIRTGDTLPATFTIQKIGLGTGKRKYETPSMLRAMLIEIPDSNRSAENLPETDSIWVLEANIDDCSGEALSLAMELLFAHGAKDVYYSPIFMKKNRPAYLLGVLCKEENLSKLEEIIFTYTTTIGLRKHKEERVILPREIRAVDTSYGQAMVKICSYKGTTFFYPEYESIKEICMRTGHDFDQIYHHVQTVARESWKKS